MASTLDRIAFYQNRRDEVPNQELARELAERADRAGVAEIAAGLGHLNANVQSDCLKVLYEIGYLKPELIADYVGDFLGLLKSKNNRMVWGGMIALATVASLRPQEIWAQVDAVLRAVENGSVITVLWGVRALAQVSAADLLYEQRIFPFLLGLLGTCIPRDVPSHAESMLCAVNAGNRAAFRAALEARRAEMTPSQLARLKAVLRQIEIRE